MVKGLSSNCESKGESKSAQAVFRTPEMNCPYEQRQQLGKGEYTNSDDKSIPRAQGTTALDRAERSKKLCTGEQTKNHFAGDRGEFHEPTLWWDRSSDYVGCAAEYRLDSGIQLSRAKTLHNESKSRAGILEFSTLKHTLTK
jgi:hypothetical protein